MPSNTPTKAGPRQTKPDRLSPAGWHSHPWFKPNASKRHCLASDLKLQWADRMWEGAVTGRVVTGRKGQLTGARGASTSAPQGGPSVSQPSDTQVTAQRSVHESV